MSKCASQVLTAKARTSTIEPNVPSLSHFQADPTAFDEDGLVVGSRVGRYKLLALLASGGMAHVWAAEPEGSGGIARTVAIKVIRSEFAQDLDYARMFIDEATIATAVRHPNVCETYELDHEKSLLFMAMEWIAGESLGGLLRKPGGFYPLPHSIAARIAADACAGLHAAHEALDSEGHPLGVIHRDVSPPNILISVQGQVKVTDFGVAKAKYQLHERTKTGEVKGKFGYLAPEQIAGEPCDRRVDVYAMGCVLYVATLGARPFGNGPEAMTKILLGAYQAPSELDPHYPPSLEAIVRRALEKNPAQRFQTADEMREALEHWLWEQRLSVTSADLAEVVRERLAPEAAAVISELQRKTRGKSNVAYQKFLQTLENVEPPTASNAIPSTPRPEPPPPASDDGPTLVAKAAGQEPTPKPEEQSGWHRTGPTAPTTTVTATTTATTVITGTPTVHLPSSAVGAAVLGGAAAALIIVLWYILF